jgi:LacI family transcriptional regulator
MAVDHLLRLGHRRIAYLVGRPNYFTQVRLAAYQDALLRAGIEPQLRWVRHMRYQPGENEFVAAPRERMMEWLNEDWRALGCTALLAHNDQAARGVIEVLSEAGLRVPGDVSVVGFDGAEAAADVADGLAPRLTTIEVPLQEVGRRSIELLLQLLNGESGIESIVLPVRLLVGGSTAPPLPTSFVNSR